MWLPSSSLGGGHWLAGAAWIRPGLNLVPFFPLHVTITPRVVQDVGVRLGAFDKQCIVCPVQHPPAVDVNRQ